MKNIDETVIGQKYHCLIQHKLLKFKAVVYIKKVEKETHTWEYNDNSILDNDWEVIEIYDINIKKD